MHTGKALPRRPQGKRDSRGHYGKRPARGISETRAPNLRGPQRRKTVMAWGSLKIPRPDLKNGVNKIKWKRDKMPQTSSDHADMVRKDDIEQRLLRRSFVVKTHTPTKSSGLPLHWEIYVQGNDDSIATIWESAELAADFVTFLEQHEAKKVAATFSTCPDDCRITGKCTGEKREDAIDWAVDKLGLDRATMESFSDAALETYLMSYEDGRTGVPHVRRSS